MAKSSRSSTKKANNQRKVAKIFGPAEAARVERLSARLQELAKQPKPESADVSMDIQEDVATKDETEKAPQDETTMDVDSVKPSRPRMDRKRIDKRRQKKAPIVFRKYGDRQAGKRKKKN